MDHLVIQRPYSLPQVVPCGPNLQETIESLPDLAHPSFLVAEDGTMLRLVKTPAGRWMTDNSATQELGFRTFDDSQREDPKNNG